MADPTNHLKDDSNEEDSLSDDDINHYLYQYEEIQRDLQEMATLSKSRIDAILESLIGRDILERMHSDQEETLRYFADANPNIRRAAIHVAAEYWRLTGKISTQCEMIALTDPNSDVRETAIRAMGSCYSRTKDHRVGHILATIILDDTKPDSIHIRAYTALVRVHGAADYHEKDLLPMGSPVDFNRLFVEQYFHGRQEK